MSLYIAYYRRRCGGNGRKKDQQGAFQKAKCLLISTHVLTHYDDHKKLVVSCDASPYDVRAMLPHIMPDGTERPIG